ncbi:MAG: (2Fe-2S)-binding protein [Dermatophilaceae bacterium]
MTRLSVNGSAVTSHAAPDTPLLWVLRDELNLTGTKYSCGIAQCGACMVLVDGRSLPSCVIPINTVAGQNITTIEGLAADPDQPVIQAWAELDVPQCGYCQSGQIVAATAVLERYADPTSEEVAEGLSRNRCRCGTYQRIQAAVRRAAELRTGGAREPSHSDDDRTEGRQGGDR